MFAEPGYVTLTSIAMHNLLICNLSRPGGSFRFQYGTFPAMLYSVHPEN